MTSSKTVNWKPSLVWVLRLLSGFTFIVSGWAKAVDPYGLVYKIGDYLSAWDMAGVFPQELVVVGAMSLSIFEFTTGVLLATGCWRRGAPLCALGLMAFMLPLTIYIAIANPVSDCGCFGDLIVMSNTATMVKNIVLTAVLILLLVWNKAAATLFRPSLQCGVIAISVAYALVLSFIGWNYQPVVDFRPYSVGSAILSERTAEAMPTYLYEKGGQQQEFPLDALPDSTWTFVRAIEQQSFVEQLAIFDGEDEVTGDLLSPAAGATLMLLITEPDIDYLTRARFANELYAYAEENNIYMFAVVATSGETFDLWMEYARPAFEVYSASDTSLKQLARGAMSLVMLQDGKVVWKRNFANIHPEILNDEKPLDGVRVFDDGRVAWWLFIGFMVLLTGLFVFSSLVSVGSNKKKKDDTNNSASTPA